MKGSKAGMTPGASLTAGSVTGHLVKLTAPMVVGILAVISYNLVDTWFVSRLGTKALAAMGFTFPVAMIVQTLALGLGVGTSSVLSRAIGKGNRDEVRRLTSHALVLAVLIVAAVAALGMATIGPLFRLLGATEDLLPLIRSYMEVWYLGVICVVVPMVGNNAIRATGDSVVPGAIMVSSALVNVILDPMLIFGFGPIPAMGIRGAAVATVIGRSCSLCISLAVLHFREGLLEWKWPSLQSLWNSWKPLLAVGLPAAATNIIIPMANGMLTRLVAAFGPAAVAGFGAATRIQSFSLIPLFALSTALVPFVGQNMGARHYDRCHRGEEGALLFAGAWGMFCWLLAFFFASPLARLFSRDPQVILSMASYLRVVFAALAFHGACDLATAAFNGRGHALTATALNGLRMFGLTLPLAWIGSRWGLQGMFAGMAGAAVLSAIVALATLARLRRRERILVKDGEENAPARPENPA